MSNIGFNSEQNAILDCASENIIVSACAGSGKSSTLVEKANREILLSSPWKKVAILTFTNKSKDDLISKVTNSSIVITTFHGFIFENIFPFDPLFSNEIKEFFQNRANTYAEWLDAFQNKKIIIGSNGKKDFVLEHALWLANKINVIDFLKSKFYAVYIDEAQDNNIQQYKLIEIFIKSKIKILMVGDPNQTLYEFRGACSKTFNRYVDDSRFDSFKLSENFRCHHIINKIANSYSFPIRNDCENGKGYIVTNINKLDEIVEKLKYETIAFLKKANYDLVDYDGKFAILRELSFSKNVGKSVQKIVICLLKMKFKTNYFIYNLAEDLQIDIQKYTQKEMKKFKNFVHTFIDTEVFDSLNDALNMINFVELSDQIYENYRVLSKLEETKNFFQDTRMHVTMTIHSSKGLEFDNIIIRKDDLYHNGVLQENNFYVTMTRAKNRVLVIL